MTQPLKVYVASKLNRDTINATFQWPDGFQNATKLDDAEFIVLDVGLGNLPDDWFAYKLVKSPFYVPTENLPVLFVALGDKIDPLFNTIQTGFKQVELPVYHTAEELFEVLRWLQCIFPFYNQKKEPTESDKVDKAMLEFILSKLKGNPGR